MSTTSVETVVIGGGQAGLAVGYHLRKHKREFVILDAAARTGDAWRQRWDSLRLFTPAHLDGLDGMRFPGPPGAFPTKDQMADYLEAYARRFQLPIEHGVRVDRLARRGSRFEVSAGQRHWLADNVVVAMANLQAGRIPAFAAQLRQDIRQLHSQDYRNLEQLEDGPALIVGLGNSGAEIAMELVKSRPTLLAGKQSGAIPWRIEPVIARHVLIRVLRFLGHHVLTIRTPIGRKARPVMVKRAAPLIRVKPRDLVDAGVTRLPRIAGVRDGLPVTEDEQTVEVANVIWCTGFLPGFAWIDLPVLGDFQVPEHRAGIVPGVPGLYFVGLHFLYSFTSETVNGVSRDARRIVRHLISAGRRAPSPAGAPELVAG